MSLVCDIGGTYIRIAQVETPTPIHIRKYAVADFPDLQSALADYCKTYTLSIGGDLMIATAGYEDAGVWKFVNQNTWIIDPRDLEAAGWSVQKILNDFEAAAWRLLEYQDEQGTVCLIGPGTGLGLAYLHTGDRPYVQKTHGGHIPVAAITDEQWAAIRTLPKTRTPVFENLVSGPGLQHLRAHYDEDCANRLFHEFFALFAATTVVTVHAYDGLYLTGGVLENLIKEGKFDQPLFEKYFHLNLVDSVARDLKATPITILKDPYPALKGLLYAP